MVKHTTRKTRRTRGGAWYNPLTWFSTEPEPVTGPVPETYGTAPAAAPAAPTTPVGPYGGRKDKKTRRRKGGRRGRGNTKANRIYGL